MTSKIYGSYSYEDCMKFHHNIYIYLQTLHEQRLNKVFLDAAF